jgi:hypothetical protein
MPPADDPDLTAAQREVLDCRAKLDLAHDRESDHAAAAAVLDEAVVVIVETINRTIISEKRPKGALTPSSMLRRLLQVHRVLKEAHEQVADMGEVPLVRLGPGGDFVRDIMESDV